jgi:hypothetical protein
VEGRAGEKDKLTLLPHSSANSQRRLPKIKKKQISPDGGKPSATVNKFNITLTAPDRADQTQRQI